MTELQNVPKQISTQGKRIALIVGANTAPHSLKSPLQCPINDAKSLAHVLQNYGNFEIYHGAPYLESAATARDIQAAIIDLTENRGDNDVLLFYFSGHAEQINTPRGKDVCLLTYDYERIYAERSPDSFLTLGWLHEQLYNQTNAEQVAICLDCCYAGYLANHTPDIDLQQINALYANYFDTPPIEGRAKRLGLRRALVATTADGSALELKEYSLMTELILKALQGDEPSIINSRGEVTLDYLSAFIKDHVSESDYLGKNFQYTCVLTSQLPVLPARTVEEKPAHNYLPQVRSTLYQIRAGEFEDLERLLNSGQKPVRVGLVGMPGIGKSQLAVQFADWCEHKQLFPDGIFWVDARGRTLEEWQRNFANVARSLNFRPIGNPNDDVSLAAHLAYYLADNPQALLILDNVDDPVLIKNLLPKLAGKELQCASFYTSIDQKELDDISLYKVPPLLIDNAHTLLLQGTRPEVLIALDKGQSNAETWAARHICRYLGYHPMALTYLRTFLRSERDLTLQELASILQARGILDLTREYPDEHALLETFRLVWEKIHDEQAQKLFKLAVWYPDITLLPIWLIGLTANLGQQDAPFTSLRRAHSTLQQYSFVDYVEGRQGLQLHSLICEFGQQLLREEGEEGIQFLAEAGSKLQQQLEMFAVIEERAQKGYWNCLDDIRKATLYIEKLTGTSPQFLERIERYLDQESHLLASANLWPQPLPGLFYQQVHNRLFEDAVDENVLKLHMTNTSHTWLRQCNRLGLRRQEPERVFVSRGSETTSVAFSPDGEVVLLGSQNGNILALEVRNGRPLTTLEGHQGRVTGLAFSADGTSIVTSSLDGTTRLWHWHQDFRIATFEFTIDISSKGVTGVAFSPDGKILLLGVQDTTAYLWDRETQKPLLAFGGGHSMEIASVAFSPDGTKVVTGSWDESMCLWEATTGKLLQRFAFRTQRIWQGSDLITHLVNALTGEEIQLVGRQGATVKRAIYTLTFAPEGGAILVGYQDGMVRLWDTTSGSILQNFNGHNDIVTSVAFSPDGKKILTGSADGTVRIWQIADAKELMVLDHAAWVNSIAYAPDGQRVLTGTNEQLASLWNISSLQASIIPTMGAYSTAHTMPITVARLARYGTEMFTLTGAEDGTVYLWKLGKRLTRQLIIKHQDLVTSVAFSPTSPRLLTASQDGQATIWELASNGPQRTHILQEKQAITRMEFSPDGQTILMGLIDGSVYFWKAKKGQQARIALKYMDLERGTITCAAFSPDGHDAIVGTDLGWLAVISTRRKTVKHFWKAHSSTITSVCYAPDGRLLLSSGLDEKTVVWEADKKLDELALQEKEVEYFAFSTDGTLLLSCARRGGEVRIWERIGDTFQLRGLYSAYYRVGTAYFGTDKRQIILVDMGGTNYRPNFYELKIENLV